MYNYVMRASYNSWQTLISYIHKSKCENLFIQECRLVTCIVRYDGTRRNATVRSLVKESAC